MQCPVCHVELQMSDRQGVEIDYCPKCRGVWLDRGELDKIVERSDQFGRAGGDYDERGHRQGGEHHGHKHKKKSFWHELFD